jgi:predicted permease
VETAWGTILPIFAVVAAGYWLTTRSTDPATLADLAVRITSPALLFSLLSDTSLDASRFGVLAGGTLAIATGTAALAYAYTRANSTGRGFLLPAVFFNGGNMGLASCRLAFGPAGLEAGAVPFVTIAVLTSFFGIWIAKGRNGLVEALRLPLLWGAAAGIAVAVTGTRLPGTVMEPIRMLGAMAVPLMLLTLGVQLRGLAVAALFHSAVAVAVRMGGGFACAWLFVEALDVRGVDRGVLLLMSVMPAAVINSVIAQRYGADPALVASAVVLGTFASLVSIPLVLLHAVG